MDMKAPATIPYFLQERIRELIIDGTLRPGQPVREQDLEKRFGTSRSPIREALRLLQQNGLVTHMQRRGFRVTVFTEKEIADQYKLRAELEAYAIRELAEIEDLSELNAELAACHERLAAAFSNRDPMAYLSEIKNFYAAIAQHTGNRPLCEIQARLSEAVQPIRYNLLSRRLEDSKSVEYTRQIMEALKGRDFERAAQLKREHVLRNLPMVLAAYKEAQYAD